MPAIEDYDGRALRGTVGEMKLSALVRGKAEIVGREISAGRQDQVSFFVSRINWRM